MLREKVKYICPNFTNEQRKLNELPIIAEETDAQYTKTPGYSHKKE